MGLAWVDVSLRLHGSQGCQFCFSPGQHAGLFLSMVVESQDMLRFRLNFNSILGWSENACRANRPFSIISCLPPVAIGWGWWHVEWLRDLFAN
jgi:hypothetical protein